MRQPQTPRPPLVGGPPNRGPEAAAIFGEGYPPRLVNSQRCYPSPNSLSGFALGECRPSRKGRAGAEFVARESLYHHPPSRIADPSPSVAIVMLSRPSTSFFVSRRKTCTA